MKKKIIFGILAILLISSIIAGSLAWFYINENTYVDFGSDIVCEAGNNLEISADGGNTWSGLVNKTGFSSETVDISGDGISFFKPVGVDDNAEPTGFVEAKAINAEGVGDYIDLQLMFRSSSKMSVCLSDDSFILPADVTDDGNIFGDFSRDYIAGATRIAFIHNDEVKMIWAPNPDYELKINDDGGYEFIEEGNSETAYYYTEQVGTEYVKTAFTNMDYATSRFVAGNTGADSSTTGNSARLFTLTPAENDYGIGALTVRIWFEGTDREASEALAGGRVKVKLKFTGVDKEDNVDGQKEIDTLAFNSAANAIDGIKNGMSFSFDGVAWEKYNSAESNLPDLSAYNVVYFRYDETDSYFKTTINEISIS